MKIRNYFSPEPVNTGRQPEVDLLRGFAVLFMIWVHVVITFPADDPTTATRLVSDIMGSPLAAPMFMIALGIGTCYSRTQSAAHMLHRAFSMFWIGLVLNVARYALPSLIYFHAADISVPYYWMYVSVFGGDILQLAFFTFLFLAFARWRKWSAGKMLLFGVLASLAGWKLRWTSTGNEYVDIFMGWIWGADDNSCFPFLNWIIFPIAGVCIGQAMLHCRDKNRVYRLISPVCLLAGAAHMWYSFTTKSYYLADLYDYYFLTTVDAFFIILLAIGLLGQNALLIRMVSGWRFPTLKRLSRNVNTVYCIHWTLLMHFSIFCSLSPIGDDFTFLECTFITVVLIAVSDLLAVVYQAWKKRSPSAMPRLTSRSLRVLNAMLFAGGVSVQRVDKE